jgi:hypothetical protein
MTTTPDAGEARDRPQSLGSIGDLLGDITSDFSTLVRQEIELAKAEAKQTATQAGQGAGMFAGAAVGAWLALLFASVALWWALGSAIDNHGWAALIVAVLWAVIAAVLASIGRSRMRRAKGIPQTTQTAREIPDALKGRENTP